MTNKEAIDIIKCLAWHTRPNEEDIEQAIKTLQQEPKTVKSCDTCKHDEAFGCPSFIHDRCENYSEWEQAESEDKE